MPIHCGDVQNDQGITGLIVRYTWNRSLYLLKSYIQFCLHMKKCVHDSFLWISQTVLQCTCISASEISRTKASLAWLESSDCTLMSCDSWMFTTHVPDSARLTCFIVQLSCLNRIFGSLMCLTSSQHVVLLNEFLIVKSGESSQCPR